MTRDEAKRKSELLCESLERFIVSLIEVQASDKLSFDQLSDVEDQVYNLRINLKAELMSLFGHQDP